MSLPPPEHEDHVDAKFKRHNCYTAEQMQAYGQQCRADALEEAAKCAENYPTYGEATAEEIRSLK